jgi:LysR family transcriptional regulator, nitrogen assimilation regulatory protein
MDFRQMRYFLCLAQEGNVTRAARQLNIVQPALSMQIAKLEKSFGKKLFYRSTHGVALHVRKWRGWTARYQAVSASA